MIAQFEESIYYKVMSQQIKVPNMSILKGKIYDT